MVFEGPAPQAALLQRAAHERGPHPQEVRDLFAANRLGPVQGEPPEDGGKERAGRSVRFFEDRVGPRGRDHQKVPCSGAGRHVPFLHLDAGPLQCRKVRRLRKPREHFLLCDERRRGFRIDLLGQREILQVEVQTGEEALEAAKHAHLFALRKQAHVPAFDLHHRPVSCNLPLLVLHDSSAHAMRKRVNGYPGGLYGWGKTFSLRRAVGVASLCRLPGGRAWDRFGAQEQVEPVAKRYVLDLSMHTDHDKQRHQSTDDDARDEGKRASERKASGERPNIGEEMGKAHAENLLFKGEEVPGDRFYQWTVLKEMGAWFLIHRVLILIGRTACIMPSSLSGPYFRR